MRKGLTGPIGGVAREQNGQLGVRIRLSETSGAPVYLQLADQIKYLIATGDLAAGGRLPSARHLADNLSVNRNTVLNAYALLRRHGYVRANHGGGTVVLAASTAKDPYRDALRPEVLELVDRTVVRAAELGIAPEQLASLVASHASTRGEGIPLVVAFVECNRQSLSHFVGPIEGEFGVVVRPLLIADIPASAKRGELRTVDCVVTTFYHYAAVRRSLERSAVASDLFAIGARPHVSILEALEKLRKPATVGVVYFGHEDDGTAAERLRRMSQAIEQTNIKGLRVRPLLLPERPDPSLFRRVDAVVVRSENMSAARKSIPAGVRVIEFINDLDSASRHFLRDVLEDLRARKRGATSAVAAAIG